MRARWSQLLAAVVVTAFCFWLARETVPLGSRDSRVFQTGAALVGPGMYKWQTQKDYQNAELYLPYYRAPFYGLALKPLLQGNFARNWRILTTLALGLAVFLLPQALGNKVVPWHGVWFAIFFPVLLNYCIEQDGTVQLALLIGALALRNAGWPFAAGCVLAILLEKPTLFVLLPLALLAAREKRMLAGYLANGTALGLLSVYLVGGVSKQLIRDYTELIRYDDPTILLMPTARSLAEHLHFPLLWPLLAAVCVSTLWFCCRRSDFITGFCCALLGSVFVSPQSFQTDMAVCIVPGLWFFRSKSDVVWLTSLLLVFAPASTAAFRLPPPWTILNPLIFGSYIAIVYAAAWRGEGVRSSHGRSGRQS